MSESHESANIEAERKANYQIAKVKAVSAAMNEVLSEQQAEIIRRAKAKLVAQGFAVEEIIE